MKKILLMILVLFSFTGCALVEDMDNTPTKKVEEFLNKYQTLDVDVLDDLENLVSEEEDFNKKQKDLYKDIIKSNYQKMTYTVKEEEIDGDVAEVTVEINVVDYNSAIKSAEKYLKEHPEEFLTDNKHDPMLFIDYKLNTLKEQKEMITYTLEFDLTKVDKEWTLDSVSDEIIDKINGNY